MYGVHDVRSPQHKLNLQSEPSRYPKARFLNSGLMESTKLQLDYPVLTKKACVFEDQKRGPKRMDDISSAAALFMAGARSPRPLTWLPAA